jgi:outer membrane protein
MKLRISLILIILDLFLFQQVFSQNAEKNALSLDDAIKMAISNQPLIEQALDQADAADAKIKEQNSLFYPRIEGELYYMRIGPVPSIEFSGHKFELAAADNYSANISASQLVYDFGKRSAVLDLMKAYKLSALDKIALIKNNLTYQTIQTYYTILFLEKSLEVNNEQIETLQKHIELTGKKVQSGSATDFDILTTQVKVADAQNRKTDIENSLSQQKLALYSLLDKPSDSPFHLTGELKIDSANIDLESLINEAYTNRPELKLARDAEDNAAVSQRIASLTDRPNVSLIASFGVKNGYQPDLNDPVANWTAGIHASIPIFNGFQKKAQIAEANAKMKSSSEEMKALQRKIKLEVEQAAADLSANRSKIQTSEVQVDHAKQAVSRANIQYKDGVITNLDLIDAETSLAQAELMHLRVVYQNVLSRYNLLKAVGSAP